MTALFLALALAADAVPSVTLDTDGGSSAVARGPFDLVVPSAEPRRVEIVSLPPTLLGLPIGRSCDDVPTVRLPWDEPARITSSSGVSTWLSPVAVPKAPAKDKPKVSTFRVREVKLRGAGRRYCVRVLAMDVELGDSIRQAVDDAQSVGDPEGARQAANKALAGLLPAELFEEVDQEALSQAVTAQVPCPPSPRETVDSADMVLFGGWSRGLVHTVLLGAARRADLLLDGEDTVRIHHGALEVRGEDGAWSLRLPHPEAVLEAPDGEPLWPLLDLARGEVLRGDDRRELSCDRQQDQLKGAIALKKRWDVMRQHRDDDDAAAIDDLLSAAWTHPDDLWAYLTGLNQWRIQAEERDAAVDKLATTLVVSKHAVEQRIDQDAWLGDYLQPTAGSIWYRHPDLGLVPQLMVGVSLSPLPNPAEEPMWTNGSRDLWRVLHAQLNVRSATGAFGDGRLTSSNDGLPVVGVAVGAQLLPYTYVSYGGAWVGDTRGGSEPETLWLPTFSVGFRGDLFGGSYSALSKLIGG